MYLNTTHSHSGLKRTIAIFGMLGLLLLLTTVFTFSAHAASRNTALTNSARANATSATVKSVYIWATDVNVRAFITAHDCNNYPSTSCPVVGQFSTEWVTPDCQTPGQLINYGGYSNNWWTYVSRGSIGGWVNNIFIQGGQKIAGVPDCLVS